MLTFPDMATLDAQFDEAKIAMGEIRSIKELTESEWSDYWGAVQLVSGSQRRRVSAAGSALAILRG